MSDYAFLVGRSVVSPVYSTEESDEEIAYACDWIPIGWLAFFQPSDVTGIAWPPETEPVVEDGEQWPQCCAVLRSRATALALFEQRKERLSRVFPAYMSPLFDALEQTVKAARSPYIQMVLSDLDIYRSYSETGSSLRENIAAMNSDTVADWAALMPWVQARMDGDFGDIWFNGGTDFQAAVGYLPDQFARSVHPA
jgi:hypothetical protein